MRYGIPEILDRIDNVFCKFSVGIQIAGGTVTVPEKFGILGAEVTISGGTVNGSVALMSEPGNPGRLTISGGEIVCSKMAPPCP